MRVAIEMPRFDPDAVDGVIASWMKQVGDQVKRGEPIAEIETDKAIMELEAMATGVLVERVRAEGDTVPIGEVMGYLETA